MKNNCSTVLIISGGYINNDFLRSELIKFDDKFDEGTCFIIGVDKGINALFDINNNPDLLVGDFDSVDKDKLSLFKDKTKQIKLNPDKDYTDTHVAVMEAIKMHPQRIVIYGATGNRMDHCLGNISVLKLCRDNDIDAYIVDEHNRIRIINHEAKVYKNEYKYISFISYSDETTGINLSGFKYNLCDAKLIKDETRGISNEIALDYGEVSIKSGCLICIESRD